MVRAGFCCQLTPYYPGSVIPQSVTPVYFLRDFVVPQKLLIKRIALYVVAYSFYGALAPPEDIFPAYRHPEDILQTGVQALADMLSCPYVHSPQINKGVAVIKDRLRAVPVAFVQLPLALQERHDGDALFTDHRQNARKAVDTTACSHIIAQNLYRYRQRTAAIQFKQRLKKLGVQQICKDPVCGNYWRDRDKQGGFWLASCVKSRARLLFCIMLRSSCVKASLSSVASWL